MYGQRRLRSLAAIMGPTFVVSLLGSYALGRAFAGRALGNLVDNALRHSPAEKRLTLSLRCRPGGSCPARVADGGAGMAPDNLAQVFQP